MRTTYCIELAYDGTSYFGWQSQPHGNTIQDTVEKALASLLEENVRLVPASRTDTGVHAAQQFAVFRVSPGTVPGRELAIKLNDMLPDTIKIRCIYKVPPTFHPCTNARTKIYCYRIMIDSAQNDYLIKGHWRLYKSIDTARFRYELSCLEGTHDFTSFCASGGSTTSRIRTIDAITVEEKDRVITIRIQGAGFLKQMIRIIIGSAVSAAGKTSKAPSLSEVLAQKNRRAAATAAPGEGLTLEQILY